MSGQSGHEQRCGIGMDGNKGKGKPDEKTWGWMLRMLLSDPDTDRAAVPAAGRLLNDLE